MSSAIMLNNVAASHLVTKFLTNFQFFSTFSSDLLVMKMTAMQCGDTTVTIRCQCLQTLFYLTDAVPK